MAARHEMTAATRLEYIQTIELAQFANLGQYNQYTLLPALNNAIRHLSYRLFPSGKKPKKTSKAVLKIGKDFFL